jgi:ubiquitin carboxyl-terminal hydrolase 8
MRQSMIDQIKQMILEDNARSGVQPTISQPNEYRLPSSRPSSSSSFGIPTPTGTPPPSNLDGFGNRPIERYQTRPRDIDTAAPYYQHASPNQSPRQRPLVRPKPDGMHGQVVTGTGTSRQDPLAERFAKLRIAQSPDNGDLSQTDPSDGNGSISMPSPTDFKPNSQPWSPPANQSEPVNSNSPTSRPSGPREMPSRLSGPTLPPKIPLETTLPKAPDPTYSPVTSFPSQTAHNPPGTSTESNGSNPRNSSQLYQTASESLVRTNSPLKRTPLTSSNASTNSRDSTLSNASLVNGNRQYQTPRQLYDYNSYASTSTTSLNNSRSSKGRTIELPVENSISAEKLFDYIKQYHVLLIDVRSREQFDQGHIFSKSIICVEPLSLRDGLSADELEESLVLSPDNEQTLFEQRNEFDLVVFYDQSASSTNNAPALRALFDTLYEFNYTKQLKEGIPPVLLAGGLDAWIDLVGPQSLQASKTAVIMGTTRIQPVRRRPARLSRNQTVNDNSSLEIRRRRLRAHKPMTASEQEEWLRKAKQEEIDPSRYSQAPAELEDTEAESTSPLAHTYDDFFRRFPDPSDIQQSMTLPAAVHPPPAGQVPTSMPQVPSRPAPAVPRPSYHGTADNTNSQLSLARQTSAQRPPLYFPAPQTRRKLPLTGLVNYGVTCYLNATVQCLNATVPLTSYFLNNKWRDHIQRHNRGSSGNLLPINYANLTHAMWANDADAVGPRTFREFFRRQSGTEISEDRQHDAKEFLDLILDYLHSDMNRNHNRSILKGLTAEQERVREGLPPYQVSDIEWSRYLHRDYSFISTLFAGQHSSRLRCLTCNATSTIYETFFSLSVELPDPRRASRTDLSHCLSSYFMEEVLEHPWHCPNCKTDRRATKKLTLTRSPQFLIIHFKRFIKSNNGRSHKLHTEVDFPLYGLDMGSYMIPRPPPSQQENGIKANTNGPPAERAPFEPATTPPFMYDAYGVIRHLGTRTDSGHYVALVKDAARGKWFKFDDEHVRDVDIDRLSHGQRLQNQEAYIVFYERSVPR